jgi:hypothetical protein
MIDALMGKIRSLSGIVLAATALCMACGGEADANKKRVRELEEELTRLQNTHDRLDERVTSLELSRAAPEEGSSPKAKAGDEASEPAETAHLERPPLKVFRLAPPGNGGSTAPAAVEETFPGEDEQGEPRPVIRGRGQNIEKAPGSPARPSSKAPGAKLGQNDSVPVAGKPKADR